MTPDRWLQIENIFHEALELDAAERSAFIRKKTPDETLRVEVEKLLSQFEDASSFIEQPLYDSSRTGVLSALFDDSDDDPMIGQLLGAYRIERQIGRGGMGAVYEAVRADGEFRLRVALKVVKRGIDTDFVLRRFRNERQILAALDHPFITRLIDGGTTEDGRPYFVMDYIDGVQLYRYCDRQKLDIGERLRLFCRICEAVEYAHQKLVIHRDLKPSNILNTNDGSPRLLDFGIAKLLDPELAVDTLQPTATALRMMTVDYASPEQIRGEKVTYATDIYSLGVVLFELLTGYRPNRIASRAPHDVSRAICDLEPMLASEAIADAGLEVVRVSPSEPTLAGVPELRNGSGDELIDRLRGDLDNIIAKALRKSPADRYTWVANLREDVERYLDGQPVDVPAHISENQTESTKDPSAKLLAVLPLSLMSPGGTENTDEAYLTVGLADAIITRLASVRQLTVRPTSSITRYNEHQINPFRAGIELGVDYVLDGRIRRFGERLRISLQLLDVKSTSAIWAGQFDEHLTDVLELEDAISEQVAAALIPQLTGDDREKLAKRGTNDARAYEAYLRGRFYWNQFTAQSLPKALDAYQSAIDLDPEYALAYVGVADFYLWANIYGIVPVSEAYEKAEAAVRRALQIDRDLGEAYASLGLILLNDFEYEKAEQVFKKAIDLSPHYSLAHEWFSALLIGNGEFAEGMRHVLRAERLDPLSLRTKILIVWSYYQTGDLDAALAKADEVLALDANYPQGHIQRGNLLAELGRADEAVTALELGNQQMPGSALAQYHLCFAYAKAGRAVDAEKLADEMEARSRREYVKPMFLALANLAAGRSDRAFRFLRTAVGERDPWLTWLGTDHKYREYRDDARYLELLRQTRRELVNGRVRVLDRRDEPASISGRYAEAETVPLLRSETVDLRRGFLRRHAVKFGLAVAAIVLLAAGYRAGWISVDFRGQGYPVTEQNVAAIRSIAVLPFENATGDPANDYLADGISDNIIDQLSSSTDLRVLSRAATFRYKGKLADPIAIGRELGVDGVLTGRTTILNDSYSARVELISVSDGSQIFSMNFGQHPERVFSMPSLIASKVVDSLNERSGRSGGKLAAKSYTQNNEAFQLYLKGEYSRQKASPEGVVESIEFYQRALENDPEYALAYQGLALAYRSAPAYGSMSPQDAFPKARDAAQKSLAIDPSLSTAYVALASIKATYDWDFAGAETEYKRAIQFSPNNAEAHYSYGNFLVAMGRSDEALAEFRNALQIDPVSLNIQTNIGWAMYIAGDYDKAEAQIRQVIEREPKFARAYVNLGEILQEQGKFDEAIASLQKARDLSNDPLADMALGHAYAVAGRRKEAEKISADLEEKVRRGEVSPFLPAVVLAGLDEKDKAFYWLERAYQDRSNWLTLIKVGRRMKNLRDDPRFADLLKRIGF
ncbi:MAG: protein kinase [Pyrinomonadaceae bacterium]